MIVITVISGCLLISLQEHGVLSIRDHRWLPKPGSLVTEWLGHGEAGGSVGGTQQASQNCSTVNPSDNEMSNAGKYIVVH